MKFAYPNGMKILVFVGGISRDSLNRRFLDELRKLAPKSLSFSVFDIASLPFYSQDMEADTPKMVTVMKFAIEDADAVLFVTPEYNRSIPGVLKNAIDWASRPSGSNSWAGKPAAIVGASPGAIGTFGAQQHLRTILSQLDVRVMNQPTVYFNSTTGMQDNSLTDSSIAFLSKFWEAFESWVERSKKLSGKFSAQL